MVPFFICIKCLVPSTLMIKQNAWYVQSQLKNENHFNLFYYRLVIDDTSDGFKMSIYASVPIPKGLPILFNYVRPLDTHGMRKENLFNLKHFICKCKRCEDPTELKTFNSAYLCPSCQIGPVVKNGLIAFAFLHFQLMYSLIKCCPPTRQKYNKIVVLKKMEILT